jgi:hypothetical protein
MMAFRLPHLHSDIWPYTLYCLSVSGLPLLDTPMNRDYTEF